MHCPRPPKKAFHRRPIEPSSGVAVAEEGAPQATRCEPSSGGAGVSPEAQAAIDGLAVHAKLLFADAHNAGFYINSYTTKLNPGMDAVLQRLLEGVRRLHADWEASQGHPATDSTAVAARGPPGAFNHTMQMLSRSDTSVRRASWKVVRRLSSCPEASGEGEREEEREALR